MANPNKEATDGSQAQDPKQGEDGPRPRRPERLPRPRRQVPPRRRREAEDRPDPARTQPARPKRPGAVLPPGRDQATREVPPVEARPRPQEAGARRRCREERAEGGEKVTASGGRPSRQQVRHAGKVLPGLYQRETATSQRVFEVCCKRNGKVVRRRLRAQTPTDAVREQRALLAKLDAGTSPVSRSDPTLRGLGEEGEQWARSPGSTLAAGTVALYADLLDRRALRILGASTKAAAVRPAHLRGMVDRLNAEGFSGSTVHGTLTALSALFRFAVRRDFVEANPVRLLDRGDRPSTKRTKEPNYLDLAQAERMLVELPDLWRPVAALCLYAALRISEALALRWSDVDFEAGVIHVPGTKTEGSRVDVPMAAPLRTELDA